LQQQHLRAEAGAEGRDQAVITALHHLLREHS
jgi:hypothetical protein